MPWCPKCKNEYREGVEICADCGVPLVDELPEEDESSGEPVPVTVFVTDEQSIGEKLVKYLRLNGIFSSALVDTKKSGLGESADVQGNVESDITVDGTDDSDDATAEKIDVPRFLVIVADIERDAVDEAIPGLIEGENVDEDRLYELIPDLEDRFEEVENEAASKQFSELRSEASTVYVKKKDKYADLKFSGYSFIGFGVLGCVIVLLNLTGVINLFNTYSMIVMSLVFIAFFAIGIATLVRAGKVKGSVEMEDEFTEQLNEWIEGHLNDDVIDEWYDESKEDQENYFEIQERLCAMLHGEFPNINPAYIEELADERYNSYLERSAYEDPDDIPEVEETESDEESDNKRDQEKSEKERK